MQPRRVAEHFIPQAPGQTETRFDPELQSVFTPSAQQVGHSNGGHIVIDVIGDSSRSITSPADFRQLDFETGAHAEAQETPAHQIVSFAERSGLNQRTVQVSGANREKASHPDHISSNVRLSMVNPRTQNRAQSTTVGQPISQIPEAHVWRALAIFQSISHFQFSKKTQQE
ncbi:hypothetical protein PGT21_019967 [Puccinia graminis f. sp. tritici]|uniref:Uncharacterized protein n=1 Tax=Puccinia graminis f. sp. tritici TaxID=56615 RepID=A0A5B0Q308_PUCGR|nr:hypothetical protein PGT21_019967 [Puccinia graminis f. sp. tritici]KAA1124593.1 hypothetical protein PGTUg99_019562 [Puccinia graminis f. sp. tritici]